MGRLSLSVDKMNSIVDISKILLLRDLLYCHRIVESLVLLNNSVLRYYHQFDTSFEEGLPFFNDCFGQ